MCLFSRTVIWEGKEFEKEKKLVSSHRIIVEEKREKKKKCVFRYEKLYMRKKSEGHYRPTFLLDSREKKGWLLNTYHFERILKI